MSVHEINPSPPNEEVIEMLTNLLEQVKTGEVQSVAVAYSLNNLWTGNVWAGMNYNNMAIIGEVACLQQELLDFFVKRRLTPVFEEEL